MSFRGWYVFSGLGLLFELAGEAKLIASSFILNRQTQNVLYCLPSLYKLNQARSWVQSRTLLLFWWFSNPFSLTSSTSPSHNLLNSWIRCLPLPQPISCSGNEPKRKSGSPLAQTSFSHYPGNPKGIQETNREPLSYHTEFLDSHTSEPGLGKILTEMF